MKTWLGLAMVFTLSAQAASSDTPVGYETFSDHRSAPSYRLLAETESEQAHSGNSIFDTPWIAASTPEVPGRPGLGPLFNAASCNACHRDEGHGQGPIGEGPVPVALVIQLESQSADVGAEPRGDPIYGRVFNTASLAGTQAEGTVSVLYREIVGYYYPDGTPWHMREPHYQLTGLKRGPLAPTTVIKPRLAPALFGVGLLEAVPETVINDRANLRQGARTHGRLGWQAASVSIRDQTTKALAFEMGVTSTDRSHDDCTVAEADCLRIDGPPEASEQLLGALVAFQRTLAVPVSPMRAAKASSGAELFEAVGCTACHRPQLPVDIAEASGTPTRRVIAPYTDLRLHDLGIEMADRTASGAIVATRWRTAPLWGLGYRMKVENNPTFLHDGRARSTEEAILWHSGEAAPARNRFMKLWRRPREVLLRWLETL